MSTIGVLRDSLKRCEQSPQLVCHAKDHLVTKVVEVDAPSGWGPKAQRASRDSRSNAPALAAWILAMVDNAGWRWSDSRDTHSPAMATAMRAKASAASPMPTW
jgi:hypothetical protein